MESFSIYYNPNCFSNFQILRAKREEIINEYDYFINHHETLSSDKTTLITKKQEFINLIDNMNNPNLPLNDDCKELSDPKNFVHIVNYDMEFTVKYGEKCFGEFNYCVFNDNIIDAPFLNITTDVGTGIDGEFVMSYLSTTDEIKGDLYRIYRFYYIPPTTVPDNGLTDIVNYNVFLLKDYYSHYLLPSATKTITFNVLPEHIQPKSVILCDKTTASVNESIYFDGSTSIPQQEGAYLTNFEWDFDDGSTHETTKTINHSFTSSGTYDVKLTVTDSNNKINDSTHTITVS